MFNLYIDNNTSLMDLRRLILSLFIGKITLLIKLFIVPLVFYLFYVKLLNASYMINLITVTEISNFIRVF